MGVNRVAPIVTGQSTAQTIKGSLRFDASNDYLSKTFGSGNTNTWTWSGWIKKSFTAETAVPSGDGIRGIFTARSSGTNYAQLSIAGSGGNYGNKIRFLERDGTGVVAFLVTSQDFRDPSAWFHLVLVWDSSSGTSGDRVRLYINGTRVTAFSTETYPTSSANSVHNTAIAHNLGYDAEGTAYFDGYMSNVTFIDGQALGPGFFGFTDPLTGTWRPKKFRAQGTTVNDGTVWSSLVNVSNATVASGTAANLFDGDTTTKINISGGYIEIDLSSRNVQAGPEGIEVYNNEGGAYTSYQVNGREVINWQASAGWMSMGGANSKINTIRINYLSGGGVNAAFAFRVNGVIMIDSTTQNLDFGTNGFYLPLDDQNDYTTDKSGKGNNWTANGFTGTSSNPDVVPDSPSGVVGSTKPTSGITTTSSITKPSNYATWNPLDNGGIDLSNGNLNVSNGAAHEAVRSTFQLPSSGKWYAELTHLSYLDSTNNFSFGIDYSGAATPASWNSTGKIFISTSQSGRRIKDGTTETQLDTDSHSGDVLQVAYNASSQQLWIGINNAWYDSSNGTTGNPSTGANPTRTSIVNGFLSCNVYQATGAFNTGSRPFKYQPPDGYLTLCSANVRPSTVVTRPGDYVGVTTYTGTGASLSLTTGFKPDLVWVKRRNGTQNNILCDSVRGANNYLVSDLTQGENTSTTITSFDSNGFSVGSGGATGYSGYTYVGWAWKAGGNKNTFNIDDVGYATASAAGLTAGTITPTGASVNTNSGFSIIKYTGTGSAATVSHGLQNTPQFFIVKRTDTADRYWMVYHTSTGNTNRLVLNDTSAVSANSLWWNNTSPTSSVFSLGADPGNFSNSTNASGGTYIAYLWAEIPGFSKFGSYTGNGSADGPMVVTGFRPRWLLIRKVSGDQWAIYDTERMSINPGTNFLYANADYAEYTAENVYAIDMLSNGFKIRNSVGGILNTNGSEYIYAAFAEQPAFNLYGGQSLAR